MNESIRLCDYQKHTQPLYTQSHRHSHTPRQLLPNSTAFRDSCWEIEPGLGVQGGQRYIGWERRSPHRLRKKTRGLLAKELLSISSIRSGNLKGCYADSVLWYQSSIITNHEGIRKYERLLTTIDWSKPLYPFSCAVAQFPIQPQLRNYSMNRMNTCQLSWWSVL